jgi:hypothetical protein
MRIRIELNETLLKELVLRHLADQLGDAFDPIKDNVKIEVKSTQNYKAEWEPALYRAVYESYE